ncbi:ATP synthase subunit delta [Serratia symbiotica]|nr:ATP synthase subunit delta [Serratia symbiotica]
MYEMLTVARPYAKAAFSFAVQYKSVEFWQEMLTFSSMVSRNKQFYQLLSGILSPETLFKLFIAICHDKLDAYGRNFIYLMIENGRFKVLPAVLDQFIELRASLEGIAKVNVVSASPLSDEQQAKTAIALGHRLSRKVHINYTIDNCLVGGMIVRHADIVINGSIRNRLDRLADVLKA